MTAHQDPAGPFAVKVWHRAGSPLLGWHLVAPDVRLEGVEVTSGKALASALKSLRLFREGKANPHVTAIEPLGTVVETLIRRSIA